MIKFEHPKEKSNIIKVIGVGGGGSNAVTHMFHQGIEGVDFILCNTDIQVLDISPVPNKIHLGKRQLGAGNVPSVGREAAMETYDEIKEMLEGHTKMLFITAGMGGGTGTGAAPVVAEIARELDILTVGIVTIPFSFEGRKRKQQALAGIEELKKHVDTLLVISNDKLRHLYGDMKLTEAFQMADNILSIAAKGIAEIITIPGNINVDFEDVKTVMKDSGKAIMGSATASGPNRALQAIEDAMQSPLLDNADIAGAKNILLYISSGEDEISLDEVHEITDYIQSICGNEADVIWGSSTDKNLETEISITIIATDFTNKPQGTVNKPPVTVTKLYDDQDEPVKEEKPQQPIQPQRVFLDEEVEKPETPINETQHLVAEDPVDFEPTVHLLFDDEEELVEKANLHEEDTDTDEFQLIHKDSGATVNPKLYLSETDLHQPLTSSQPSHTTDYEENKDEMEKKSIEKAKLLKLMSMQSMRAKSKEDIKELERVPAYIRRGKQIDTDADSSNTRSNYSLDSKTGLRSENSFLHDNVD